MARKWYQTNAAKIAFTTTVLAAIPALLGLCSEEKQPPTIVNQYLTAQLPSSEHAPSEPSTTVKDSLSKSVLSQQPKGDHLKKKETPHSTSQLSSSKQAPRQTGISGEDSLSKPVSSQQPQSDHLNEREKAQTTPSPIPPAETTLAIYYQIKVHVSSKMKDAGFFVDGEPAQIIDDLTTVKVIRIKAKDSNHTISVKKDSIECSKQLFITQNNVVVTLCP